MEPISLDEIAVLEATDKSSIDHDYARQYERAFAGLRHAPIDVLEIGVASGASLRMWEKFFSQARLIGVDIIDGCIRLQGGRKVIEIGSQADPVFLDTLALKYSPTIIIDDGSHQADHIEFTLRHLFPLLLPGGCYVIEDLNFHVAGGASPHPVGALKLALDIAFAAAFSHPDATAAIGLEPAFVRTVDRVEFSRHAAFIWKKAAEADVAQTVAHMKDLVEQSGSGENWFHFVHYAMSRGASLDLCELAARNSIDMGNNSGLAHWRLSEILERRGNIAESIAAAEEASALAPHVSALKDRIERLKTIAG